MELKLKLFLASSLVFMMLALLTGIFRLMNLHGISSSVLVSLYPLHPFLMIYGFLASIVLTERVAGIRVLPNFRASRIPSASVPLIAFGMIFVAFGYVDEIMVFKVLGAVLLLFSCAIFLFILNRLSVETGNKLPFYFMMLSVVSLALSSILVSVELPSYQVGFVMLLLSFPVLFILGERMELTRFLLTNSSSKLRITFVLSALAIGFFGASSLDLEFALRNYIALLGFSSLFVSIVLMLSIETKNFKLLSKSPLPLQRYVATHAKVAYIWGVAGIVLGAIFTASMFKVNLYDPFIHSIAVGFIGTMLLAHGPVILPSVTGRQLKTDSVSLLPLLLLTVANGVRVVGDVLVAFYQSTILGAAIGLSGWLILGAVILFLRGVLVSSSGKAASVEAKSVATPQ